MWIFHLRFAAAPGRRSSWVRKTHDDRIEQRDTRVVPVMWSVLGASNEFCGELGRGESYNG